MIDQVSGHKFWFDKTFDVNIQHRIGCNQILIISNLLCYTLHIAEYNRLLVFTTYLLYNSVAK